MIQDLRATQCIDYRQYLRHCLESRKKRTPGFSLRAFAKKIGISPSLLSDTLKGSKNLSPKSAVRIADRLGLRSEEKEAFVLLVDLECSASSESKEQNLKKLTELRHRPATFELSPDHVAVLSDPELLALVELAEVLGDGFSSFDVSQRLGISQARADRAIAKLVSAQILVANDAGSFKKSQSEFRIYSPLSHAALCQLHDRFLQRASTAVAEKSPDQRFISTLTFALSQKKLEQVRDILREAIRKIDTLSRDDEEKSEVYQLVICAFQATQKMGGV